MFGYVRPLAPELKVKEFERFRACYCGLCHELGREYGAAGRSILNYDFVFLSMLLWGDRESCDYCQRRCLPGLFRKKCVCASAPALTVAAGYSVILAYWKAVDNRDDSRGGRRLLAAAVRLFLKRPYRKAAARYPAFDRSVRERLDGLHRLEAQACPSLDRAANQFALLLASAAGAAGEETRRALEQLLYHVGRIVYIADAYADLEEDRKAGRYNPVAVRYGLTSAKADEQTKASVRETLLSSVDLAAAALALLPESCWTPVTENTVLLGLPDMIDRVLNGTYVTAGKRLPKRPKLGQNGE